MFSTDNIKNIRIKNNLSQKDIAEKLQVSRSSYAMWESNNNIFPIKRLIDLCNIYSISLDYALGLTNEFIKINGNYNIKKSGQRLKELRLEKNLLQKEIIYFLQIDQPTWSIYENGKSIIGTPFLYMLCQKYHISADYLIGRTDEPKYIPYSQRIK